MNINHWKGPEIQCILAMPPQTPRSNAKSGVSITPSFSFGLGLLPSFRFGSPRNINLLSSLSPQRFFNKFAKEKKENPFDLNDVAASPKDGFEHSDTMNDLADIWSLTNDSQYQSLSLNLTSVNEIPSPKSCEPFLSPHDIFLKKPVEMKESKSSPVTKDDTPQSSSSLKRKRLIEDSPCTAVVAEISKSDSPENSSIAYDDLGKATKELWFAELDDVLVRCHKKYKTFKAGQSPGSSLTKLTSQNQVLSKMLYNKTGVRRSSKQIASRLSRLRKVETTKQARSLQDSITTLCLEPQSPQEPPLKFTFKKMELSFTYKRAVQGIHEFLLLKDTPTNCTTMPAEDLENQLPLNNRRYKEDFDRIIPRLGDIPVYFISGAMNLKPAVGLTSTPVSPLTDPALFCIDNGDFLSFLEFKVSAGQNGAQMLTWKSLTTIYKDEDKVLLSTREQINGYRALDNTFDLQVPFMNHFWSGYLTFLCNGSNNSNDVKNILITQVIYEGENEMSGTIHGVLTYEFDVTTSGSTSGNVRVMKMQKVDKAADDDSDENATVLVHSSPLKASPFKISPLKSDLRVDTELANQGISDAPQSVPTYNASLVHQFNPNYDARMSQEMQSRQMMHNAMQVPPPAPSRTPLTAVDPPTAPQFHHVSAGQMPQNYNSGFVPTWNTTTQYNQHVHPQMVAQAAAMQAAAQSMPQNMSNGNASITSEQMSSEKYVPVGPPNPNIANNNQVVMMQRGNDVTEDEMSSVNMMQARPNWQAQMPQSIAGQFMNQPCINSAPASQLHFFPRNDSRPNAMSGAPKAPENSGKSNNNNITFGPIMGYDPLRDSKPQPKKQKGGMNIHKFSLNPQIMYKPKKQ